MLKTDGKKINGFTLVELLLVIVVLAVIAGVGISSMSNITNIFRVKSDQETARILARNVEINILTGDVESGGIISLKDQAQTIIDTDKPEPKSGGEFIVESLDLSTGKIVITFGTNNPLDIVEIDIVTSAID